MIKRTFVATTRKTLLRRGRALLRRSAGDQSGDLLGGLGHVEREELAEIHRALERIERGIFGSCVSCGIKMEESMLEAEPTRAHCDDCVEKPAVISEEPRVQL